MRPDLILIPGADDEPATRKRCCPICGMVHEPESGC